MRIPLKATINPTKGESPMRGIGCKKGIDKIMFII
jgi:hypothetical protein